MDAQEQEPPQWANALLARIDYLDNVIRGIQNIPGNQTADSTPTATTTMEAQLSGKPTKHLGSLATYDGNREELESWISQAEAKLQVDYGECSEATRFFMVHNQLRGEASRQLQPWVQAVVNTQHMTAQGLIGQLRLSFGDPHSKEKAQRKLHKLKQTNRSFTEYFTEFRKLILEAGGSNWPDEIKKSYLEAGLSLELQQCMIGKRTGNESFEDYCNELKQASDQLEAFNLRNKNRNAWQNNPKPNALRGAIEEVMDWEPTTRSQQSQGRRAKWVSKEILEYRKNTGLCLRCGNAWHRVLNCPLLPPQRPVTLKANVNAMKAAPEDLSGLGVEPDNKDGDESGKRVALARSRRQGQQLLGQNKSLASAGKQCIIDQWREFHPKMECPLFYTTTFINDTDTATTLVDDGSQSYAQISERLAKKLSLPLLETAPRILGGVIDGPTTTICHVTHFSLDIGGVKLPRMFAYVVPNQHEELILGRPWLKDNDVTLVAKEDKLHFGRYDLDLYSNQVLEKKGFKELTQVMASTYNGIARRAKRQGQQHLRCFAASLADIDKALKPKPKVTRAEVLASLPREYQEYIDAFDPDKIASLPPHRPGIDIEIQLEKDAEGKDKEVPWGPLYGMSRDELLVLRKELTSYLDKDYIQASKSPAGAPVLFARKPGGGLRFCIDYRGLNAITRKDRYPLPLIRETLGALGRAKWLTKLDVSSAFHRIRIAKGEEWKTAFRTRYGLYEWKVCPFGLANAPATFQRYINWALRDYLDDFCSAYVDDILIFTSGSLQDHRDKVKKVLVRLSQHGLPLDIKKCEFETKATKYLGYVIEVGKGIRMDPDKTKAIREWDAPETVKGVRSFLGFCNYYRLFIKDYATTAMPLNNLTRKGVNFQWTDQENNAFIALKAKFEQDQVLANYDPDRETRLEPDASGWATGGVLSQKDEISGWRPIAFFSAKHNPAECNYDIHDKELLAIVKCMKEWHSELRGLSRPFEILTDHKNLEPFTVKKTLTERQVRWSEFLSQFNFQLSHRPGKDATVPDALSRREQDVPQDQDDSRLVERQRVVLPPTLWANPSQVESLGNATQQTMALSPGPFEDDNHLRPLWDQAKQDYKAWNAYITARDAVANGERMFPKDLELRLTIGDCEVKNNLLYYRERLWLPAFEPLTTGIIQRVHDSFLGGHPGRDTTISLLGRQFFWPGMNQQVRQFIRNCHVCGRSTIWRNKKKGLLRPLPLANRMWSEISVDFVTDLPRGSLSRATVLLVITDRFSKGTILIPVPPGCWDAEGFARLFLERYVPYHWLPRAITSDRGVQFVNKFWSRLCELLKIERRLSTAYHPETDGATERRNQEVETFLRTFTAYYQNDWDQLLPMAQISLDNKPATSTGVSPFFLSHGYDATEIVLPEDLKTPNPQGTPQSRANAVVEKLTDARDFAESALAAAQQTQEHYANRAREAMPQLQVGDKVWLNLKNIRTERLSKKLDWIHAQYTITRTFEGNPYFYELDVPKGIHKKFHVSLLRLAATDPLPSQVQDDFQPPPVTIEGQDDEYGVEKILRCRTRRIGRGSRREALVKWIGYAEPDWQPLQNLQDTIALDHFEEQYGDAQTHDGPTGEGGG